MRKPNKEYLYAWCCEDSGDDGGIGITATLTLPMVTVSQEIALKLKGVAKQISEAAGKEVKLIKFKRCEDIISTEEQTIQ